MAKFFIFMGDMKVMPGKYDITSPLWNNDDGSFATLEDARKIGMQVQKGCNWDFITDIAEYDELGDDEKEQQLRQQGQICETVEIKDDAGKTYPLAQA